MKQRIRDSKKPKKKTDRKKGMWQYGKKTCETENKKNKKPKKEMDRMFVCLLDA